MDLKLRDYQEEVLEIIENLKPRKLFNTNGNRIRKNSNIHKHKKKRSCISPST